MGRIQQRTTLLLLSITLSVSAVSLDLLVGSAGTWTVNADSDQRFFFNKASVAAYASAGYFTGYIYLPLAWTVNAGGSSETEHGVWIGDVSAYAGRAFGMVEPRLGVVAPAGYPLDGVWIGPGNVRLQAGLGLNADLLDQRDASISGELMWQLFLPGLPGAFAETGSWSLLPSVKASFRPADPLKLGVEILGSFARMQWLWGDETKLSVVPNGFLEFRLSDGVHLSAKGGAGPAYARGKNQDRLTYSSYSVNGSVSVNVYR